MSIARPRRRLAPHDRREQLVGVAQDLAARDGYATFSLDEVAERAGVTRNLIYRYFPRGRLDLFLAALHRGGEQLTAGWLTDPAVTLEDRLAANFHRMLEHSEGPSAAWLVHRQARAAVEPEIEAALRSYLERIVAGIALNHFGTPTPEPIGHMAISAYLAFAERALDEAREQDLPRAETLAVLQRTLLAAVAAALAPATGREID